MATEDNENERRVGLTLRAGETADHKINALLDLLERKGVIDPQEAAQIRVAKVY